MEANDVHFAGSFKSGKDLSDTWKRMLIHFRDVSEDKAKAITAVFPTFQSLWQTYKQSRTFDEGRKALLGVEVKKINNKCTKDVRVISFAPRQTQCPFFFVYQGEEAWEE